MVLGLNGTILLYCTILYDTIVHFNSSSLVSEVHPSIQLKEGVRLDEERVWVS